MRIDNMLSVTFCPQLQATALSVSVLCSLLFDLIRTQWHSQIFISGGETNDEGVRLSRGSGGMHPQDILKSRVPEMQFQAFWG